MSLRVRLMLAIAVVVGPLILGLRAYAERSARRSLEQETRSFALGSMQAGGRWMCELSPTTFPGPPDLGDPLSPDFGEISIEALGDSLDEMLEDLMGRAASEPPTGAGLNPPFLSPPAGIAGDGWNGLLPEFWAYGPNFESDNPAAPPLAGRVRAALVGGAELASELRREGEVERLRVVTRMPWGDGPCAFVSLDVPAQDLREELGPLTAGLLLLGGAIALVVFTAMGPIIARIRRLNVDVAASAAGLYEQPVDERGSDEIAALARSFNAAGRDVREQVQAAAQRQEVLRRFVADTTHDVMTPLTVLQGHLDGIAASLEGGASPSRADVRSSLEEVQYMAALLHNLGAAAKLEAAPALELDRVDLTRVVERVVSRFLPVARNASIDLTHAAPDHPVWIAADVTFLEQALCNVVHNAIHHNEAGGRASIVLDVTRWGFQVRVSDDGPGVSPEQLARLTERRFRATAARTRTGHGIGLSIVNDVAARLGIDLELTVPRGGGLEVTFRGELQGERAPIEVARSGQDRSSA